MRSEAQGVIPEHTKWNGGYLQMEHQILRTIPDDEREGSPGSGSGRWLEMLQGYGQDYRKAAISHGDH